MKKVVIISLVALIVIVTILELFDVIILNKYVSASRYFLLTGLILYATYTRSKDVK